MIDEHAAPLRPVPQLVASDEAAFAALYPSLRSFAGAVADRGTEPDDLVQDALVRVLQAGGLGRLDAPIPYFRRTITNLAVDRRRGFGRAQRAVRRLRPVGVSSDDYPSDLTDLDQLSPTDRAVLYLSDVEGLPLTDVADELSLSHQAARSRASRARARLRHTLDKETR